MNGAYAPPLTAPPAFADKQTGGRQQDMLLPLDMMKRYGTAQAVP